MKEKNLGDSGPIKFLKVLPPGKGKEIGLFSVSWLGKTTEVRVGIEDDLLGHWGFKMNHGRVSPDLAEEATGLKLWEVLFFIGVFKIADFLEDHGGLQDYTFSKKEFEKGGSVVDMLSALESVTVRSKWVHAEHKKLYEEYLRKIAACKALQE